MNISTENLGIFAQISSYITIYLSMLILFTSMMQIGFFSIIIGIIIFFALKKIGEPNFKLNSNYTKYIKGEIDIKEFSDKWDDSYKVTYVLIIFFGVCIFISFFAMVGGGKFSTFFFFFFIFLSLLNYVNYLFLNKIKPE